MIKFLRRLEWEEVALCLTLLVIGLTILILGAVYMADSVQKDYLLDSLWEDYYSAKVQIPLDRFHIEQLAKSLETQTTLAAIGIGIGSPITILGIAYTIGTVLNNVH